MERCPRRDRQARRPERSQRAAIPIAQTGRSTTGGRCGGDEGGACRDGECCVHLRSWCVDGCGRCFRISAEGVGLHALALTWSLSPSLRPPNVIARRGRRPSHVCNDMMTSSRLVLGELSPSSTWSPGHQRPMPRCAIGTASKTASIVWSPSAIGCLRERWDRARQATRTERRTGPADCVLLLGCSRHRC